MLIAPNSVSNVSWAKPVQPNNREAKRTVRARLFAGIEMKAIYISIYTNIPIELGEEEKQCSVNVGLRRLSTTYDTGYISLSFSDEKDTNRSSEIPRSSNLSCVSDTSSMPSSIFS